MDKVKKLLNKLKTHKKETIAVLTLVVIIAIAGVSYAWFSATVSGNDTAKGVTVTTANLSITYNGGPEYNEDNIMPGWTGEKTFTVTNTGDGEVHYNINWATLTNTFTTKTDMVYSVTSNNSGSTLSETQLPNSGDHVSIISNATIATGVTQTYTLHFRFLSRNENQNENQGKSISGKIEVLDVNASTSSEPTLADMLKTNNPPTTYTTVPGRENSVTDEGLIEGPNDDYGDKTYYFRGTAPDNYVTFGPNYTETLYNWQFWGASSLSECIDDGYYNESAQECSEVIHSAGDPMLWRVVRINGDGSVRLVLNTTTGTYSAWNTNYQSTDWDTALSYATYGNSTIKGNVETWYNTNIGNNTNYSSKVVPTKFCNDRTYTTETDYYYFGVRNRLYSVASASPSFICPTSTSEGNDIYNLNVGLLTGDEVAFAGGIYNTSNSSYYLYKSGVSRWTMSPYTWNVSSGSVSALNVISDGNLILDYLNYSYGVFPVISLSAETLATVNVENPGTSANPYVVQ